MRKLFRFKYEPCNKTCYAWCAKLSEELNALSEAERRETVGVMVKAHNHLCDNQDYSFGLDVDESKGLFVTYFRTPKSTDVFANNSFKDSISEICRVVLNADIPKVDGNCTFGDNGAEDLGANILRACVDIAYRNKHHSECACHSGV